MCGIAGIYQQTPGTWEHWDALPRMRECLHHRGRDSNGIDALPEHGIGLVHTRLSIIDLSDAGHQPMWNADRSIGLSFNGEVYNFHELRRELESHGCAFHSHTDTEVILKGYEIWGRDVVTRLNGMFAFALWDQKQASVWLARDRLGQKPLYYWYDATARTVLFASEIKAILEWPQVSRRVDPDALQYYLALGYTPGDHTMFQGVKKLLPAHWLLCDAAGISIRRYWEISYAPIWRASQREYRQTIRTAVTHAVERRLMSDVPLGAFLSGGVDSSIIVGVMSRLMREPVRTFSAAFAVGDRSPKYNVDADVADIVSKDFGTQHTRLTITFDDHLLENLRRVIWHMDEPHGNPTLVSTYLLSQQIKDQGISVILSGDCGDELFAGYGRYLTDRFVSRFGLLPERVRTLLNAASPGIPKGDLLRKALAKARFPARSAQRYLAWSERFSAQDRQEILHPSLRSAQSFPETSIDAVLNSAEDLPEWDALNYADLMLWVPEESNARVDKMSMAYTLEVRSPFEDYTLAEQAMRIPAPAKMRRFHTKRLLKDAFADLLPEIVLKRPKWGWSCPVYYWLKEVLWSTAQETISALPRTGLFSENVLKWAKPEGLRDPYKVWTLLVFGLWYRTYIENE